MNSFRHLERIGALLRSIGFGAALDSSRAVLEPRLAPVLGRPVTVRGVALRGRSIGHLAHLRAWRDGQEEKHLLDRFEEAMYPGAHVLDVGGYLGLMAAIASDRVGPDGRVVAVEPNPSVRELLVENLALNDLQSNVEVLGVALGAARGAATLYVDKADGSASSLAPYDALPRTEVSIDVVPGRDLLGTLSPRIVKIDVEGFEPRVLRGLRGAIPKDGPLVIFTECNPRALKAAGSSMAQLLDELAIHGCTDVRLIDEERQSLRPLTQTSDVGTESVNLECRRPST